MNPVMIDASIDPQAALTSAKTAGYDVCAVALYTDDGGAGAHVATPTDVATLHSQGLPVLAIFNGAYVNGGTPGTGAQGQADGAQAVKEANALGLPKGCVLAVDIEEEALPNLTGAYLVEIARNVQAAGWVCMFYAPARQEAFNTVIDDAIQQDEATIAACLWWLPSWLGTGDPVGTVPQWDNPLGPATLPWSPQYLAKVVAWQWWGGAAGDTFDISIIRDPLPLQLWGPPAVQPTPVPVSSSLSAQVAALEAQVAQLQAANAALQQKIAAAKAALG
jgi:hypothetical protein